MRWAPGARKGKVVAGGRGPGDGPEQLHNPCAVPRPGALFETTFSVRSCMEQAVRGAVSFVDSNSASYDASAGPTVNVSRKATVVYPAIQRLLFHMLYVLNL